MPAGMVRPRASQVAPLGAGAVGAYRRRGWAVSDHGRIDAGTRLGPCAICRQPCVRYGPTGSATCPLCQPNRPT